MLTVAKCLPTSSGKEDSVGGLLTRFTILGQLWDKRANYYFNLAKYRVS